MSSSLSSSDSTSYSSNHGSQERSLFPFMFRCFLQKTLDYYFSQMTTAHQGHQGKLMLRIAVTKQLIMPMKR
ncbi:hypothetical protein D5086_003301 [Populus alba]|uniref:Uncharacterized protein n=1 Tax=Populus alba TaxID=43335 RepID=A0ACC4D440_POPAL